MPKLPTYTAKLADGDIVGGRRATAEDFGATDLSGVARDVQRAGSAIIQDKEENETRKVLVRQAEIRAKYAKRLDEAVLNGEDINKIREELDNEQATVSEGLQTKRGVETSALHSANTGAVFDNQANNILVHRASAEAKLEGSKLLRGESTLVQSNPAYLAQAEANVKTFMETYKGRISPQELAKHTDDLHKELNVAAAISVARTNPEDAKKRIESGEWNLSAAQRVIALNKADTEINARRANEAYQRQQRQFEVQERDDKARDKHFAGIMGGTATNRQIMDDPDLRPATREHMIMLMKTRANEMSGQNRKSDNAVFNDLYMRAIAPEGTAGKLYTADAVYEAVKAQAEGGRGLNTADAERIRGIIAGQKDENGKTFGAKLHGRMRVIENAMAADPVISKTPGLMVNIQLALLAEVDKKADAMRKAAEKGNGPPPAALLDPESKEYYFTPNRLKDMAQDVRRQMLDALPKVPDLRKTPEVSATIEVGQTFIDPNGVSRVMTQKLKDTLAKQPQAARSVLAPGMSDVVAP